MDAIGSTRVSEFMNSYVNSSYLDPSSDPQHRAAMDQSLMEMRLLTTDLARVESMLDEIAGQRAFIQWMTSRIQEAEQRGEDTYLLKWDRGFAGAKIRDLQAHVLALLGPSLEARLVDSRERFRLTYLASGALGKASGWAGDDAAIQDALDGMLIPDSAQAVVNHYLFTIGTLQRDAAALEKSLAPGQALALHPRRTSYAQVLSDWRRQVADQIQTVMGILDGTVDASQVDPVPWSLRSGMTVAARPPVNAVERLAFQLSEDSAWLSSLSQEARSIEAALAQMAQETDRATTRALPLETVREQTQRRYDLIQRQRLLVECIQATRSRLETLRTSGTPGDGPLRTVDLDVANARRKLEARQHTNPVDPQPTQPPLSPDVEIYESTLPLLKSEEAKLATHQQSLVGTIERLTLALEVPKGFKLSDEQRGELALLRSQRAELRLQQQLVDHEWGALKALISSMTNGLRRGRRSTRRPPPITTMPGKQRSWLARRARSRTMAR